MANYLTSELGREVTVNEVEALIARVQLQKTDPEGLAQLDAILKKANQTHG